MAGPRVLRIDTITEHLEGECPDCGFDALIRLRGLHLNATGVHTLFDEQFCARCRAEERRERGQL